MAIAPGTLLGRYRVLSQLGEGGMGEVYLAEDTGELERKVAVKVLPERLAADTERMRRFAQEARATSRLNHPNILTVYEFGHEGEARFIAAEYVEGVTLRQYAAARRLKLAEVLDIAGQVAAALAAAHEAGVVHRDLKPENVMVRRDHIVKVLDFGLAKAVEPDAAAGVDTGAGTQAMVRTEPGRVMGTVAYMSPEQSRGAEVDHRTDVWSLGVMLYELVAGRVPFGGKDVHRQIVAIQDDEPEPLSQRAADVPARLEEIVAKALAKEPDDRYQTAKDLMIDLRTLRRRVEVDAELDRSTPPEPARVGPATETALMGGATEPARPTSSAEYLVTALGRRKRAFAVALVLLALVASGVAYLLAGAGGERAIGSIAVLPLVNESGDPALEYLSDGISESLINSLTELPQLKVTARGAAFRYRGRDVDARQVGSELNVGAVLTGRVRQSGERLSIQVDLVDAADGSQLWGEEYNRAAVDALSVKQEIAREVTEKLRLRLSRNERQRLVARDTTNSEAYELYLRGRYYWNKRTAESLERAVEQFQQAVERDPTYALAYVGLADCYGVMDDYTGAPGSETYPKAKAYAERALEIDDSLAEAHATLGLVYLNTWQWEEAEREFKRAIELNPNYPTTYHWYNSYLRVVGRIDEAVAAAKRAQALDPLSPIIGQNVALNHVLKGELDEAREQYEKIIDFAPDFPSARSQLGAYVHLREGRDAEAIAEIQKAVELSGRSSNNLYSLGYAYGRLGDRAKALAIARELEEKHARREATTIEIACVYAGLGEKDQAFAWLEKGAQLGVGQTGMAYDLEFESLRDDPRYADLLRRMGLRP